MEMHHFGATSQFASYQLNMLMPRHLCGFQDLDCSTATGSAGLWICSVWGARVVEALEYVRPAAVVRLQPIWMTQSVASKAQTQQSQ
jgi:hypothetical protein